MRIVEKNKAPNARVEILPKTFPAVIHMLLVNLLLLLLLLECKEKSVWARSASCLMLLIHGKTRKWQSC